MQYADMPKMPIVVSTSSIALQKAIITEYIPELSRILLETGVIKTPLTAVLRKGKENYLCERNLRAYLTFEGNSPQRRVLERLLPPSNTIDLSEFDITPHVKRNISVSGRCSVACPYHRKCEYIKFREQAQSLDIDIQVCNHNYLLADTLHRANGKEPLIPNYQALIIDEAHKFLQAARTMYGVELSNSSAPDILATVDKLIFKREGYQKKARKAAKKLYDESARLFQSLAEKAANDGDEDKDDTNRLPADIDLDNARHLRNIRDIADRLMFSVRDEAFYVKAEELLAWVREKYNVDTTLIDLRKILATSGEYGSYDEQKELMSSQIIKLHKAICELPEIKNSLIIDINHRRQACRQSYSPERQFLFNDSAKAIDTIWQKARRLLPVDSVTGKCSEWLVRLIWDLERIREQAASLLKQSNLIYWFENDVYDKKLRAIPKNLDQQLFADQWKKGIPTILTSGTLSAGGDFSHIKRTLGLERLGNRVSETSKPSPFNHRDNAMLYISETMPFPDRHSNEYIVHTTDEIEKLVRASHGHAAVLFTSYRVMDMVWGQFEKRKPQFPLFRLDKGGVREIERFKASGNGVLFASGAMWEGIDIPGDALSMLIIVKLPFAVPDPISDYEQTLYKDMFEYKRRVIMPEMLIKLKQGFGRLIRLITDTGAVAILDSRANSGGAYRECILATLPDCRVTGDIGVVEKFFIAKKPPKYFI